MSHFRKKPVVIEAFCWTGGPDQTEDPIWIVEAIEAGTVFFCPDPGGRLHISTLEGTMTADKGDWIIKGVKGEIYACKPEIFEATYDAVSIEARSDDPLAKPLVRIGDRWLDAAETLGA